jgi:hypothetical protein
MESIKWIAASGSFLAGVYAASLWYSASRVFVMPMWYNAGQIEPLDPHESSHEWTIALLQTAVKSGALNKQAAIWTAVTVVLSGIATLATLIWP